MPTSMELLGCSPEPLATRNGPMEHREVPPETQEKHGRAVKPQQNNKKKASQQIISKTRFLTLNPS